MAVADAARPFVSVVVPVFNGAETIGACLTALLAQDYPSDRREIIVVDNNSTDGTAAIVQTFAVRYVREEQVQSSYAARNRGIREARGELIAFTDADCVASPQWLRRGAAGFANASVGGVAGSIRPLPPATLAQRYASEKGALSQEKALAENSFLPAAYTANAFYPKVALERAGLFDPMVKSGGDADLAWRVQERLGLSIALCPDAVVQHEHRRTVRELLRQRRNYGYGSVLNYLKHRDRMGPRTLKHAYWELRAFTGKCGAWLRSVLRRLRRPRDAQARERMALDGLDVLVFLAKKAGQLHAAVAHRVWYF